MEVVKDKAGAATPVRRGWWRRNWLRVVLLVILVPLAAAVGGYFYKFGPILFSEPYKRALAAVQHSPKVIDKLGEPVVRGDWAPAGLVNPDADIPEARLNFSIRGPKSPTGAEGLSHVSVISRKIGGEWGFAELKVILPGNEEIDLRDEVNSQQPNGAPPPDKNPPKPATTNDATPDQDIKIDLPDAQGK